MVILIQNKTQIVIINVSFYFLNKNWDNLFSSATFFNYAFA